MTKITLRNQTVEVTEMDVELADIISEIGVSDYIDALDDTEAIIRELDEDDIVKHFDWSRMDDTDGLATALGKELFGDISEVQEFVSQILQAMSKIDADVADAAARGVIEQAKDQQ